MLHVHMQRPPAYHAKATSILCKGHRHTMQRPPAYYIYPYNIKSKTVPQREQPPQSCRSKNTVRTSDSAIGQHLLDNPDCAKLYNDDMFRIIGRAQSSFNLAVLESIYIQTKKPPLCRQKKFVFSLGLQW